MATINTDFMVGFNNLVTQLKQKRDKVSPEEWNSMWNVLASQVNQNAQFLNDLKRFVVGEGTGEIHVPDNYQTLFDAINNISVTSFKASVEPPTDSQVTLWAKIIQR